MHPAVESYCTVGFISAVSIAVRCRFISHQLQRSTKVLSLTDIRRIRKVSDCSSGTERCTISANSLEESKRKARSPYDNIPDLNQQYLAELNWAERKYGPKRMRKDIVKEAQKSILRPKGARAGQMPSLEASSTASDEGADETEPDLSQYSAIRNKLLGDTLFLGALGLCASWGLGTIKDVQSFGVGLLGSLVYVYLLSRSVDRMADAVRQSGMFKGDALQPARIAILVLLVIASAKNSEYLSVLPVLFGFFTYKVATLVPLLTGEAFD